MKLNNRLNGTILYFALFLMIISGIIIGTMMLSFTLRKNRSYRWQIQQRLIDNVNSAMGLAMELISSDQPQVTYIDLYGEGQDSVSISQHTWGFFRIIKCSSRIRHSSYSKSALLGVIPENSTPTLFLPNQRDELFICGKSRIVGNVFVPGGSVKKGYIENKTFNGAELVEGRIEKSGGQMPQGVSRLLDINKENMLLQWKSMLLVNLPRLSLSDSDTIKFPFHDTVWVYSSTEPIDLLSGFIDGPVFIESETSITISSSFSCRNIIISAPKILIEDDFVGTLQAVATDTLITGTSCIFNYPSVLAVSNQTKTPYTTFMDIGEGSNINGIIICLKKHQNTNSRSVLNIKEGVLISGQVISNGLVQHRGIINGTLAAQELFLATKSAYYRNHLLDAVINRNELPANFAGSNYWSTNQKWIVIKWL